MSKGKLLRGYRKERRIPAVTMAKRLKIAVSTLNSIENGTRPITAARAVQIERVTKSRLLRADLLPAIFNRA